MDDLTPFSLDSEMWQKLHWLHFWQKQDGGNESIMALFELSTAFNSINYGILLDRLQGLGVGSSSLSWLSVFLEDQYQSKLRHPTLNPYYVGCHRFWYSLLFKIYMKLKWNKMLSICWWYTTIPLCLWQTMCCYCSPVLVPGGRGVLDGEQ